MAKKLNYNEVKLNIEVNGYTLISDNYINSRSKLTVKCQYDHVYEVTYGQFSSGRRCPYCSNRVKIEESDVILHLKDEGYSLISKFNNSNNKIKVLCPNNHEWEVTYQKFKKGRRCSKCNNKYSPDRKSHTNWDTELVRVLLAEEGFELINNYINSNSKLKIKCPKGHVNDETLSHFLKGHKCNDCSVNHYNNASKSFSEEQTISIFKDKGFEVLGKYVNSKESILVRCKISNHLNEISPSNLKSGTSCKGCNMSTYEKVVYSILSEFKLNIINEYVHPKLKRMRFDLAIMNDDITEPVLLVEVDGEVHYKNGRFGNSKSLNITKFRDNKKDIFCKNNNIKLFRIPYFKVKDRDWIISKLLEFDVINNKKGE